jgi:GNAT superfamily N-acetyltransferase
MTAEPSSPLFCIRGYRAADADFVHKAWLYSNRFSPRVRGMTTKVYHGEWERIIARLVARSTVNVAHAPEDEEGLLGFACYELGGTVPIVHQVYVKGEARRLGVATALLSSLLGHAAVYTHMPVVRWLMPDCARTRIPKAWYYNPEVISR